MVYLCVCVCSVCGVCGVCSVCNVCVCVCVRVCVRVVCVCVCVYSACGVCDPWPLLLSIAAHKGHVRFHTLRHVIMRPRIITTFLDSILAASWHLPVCCNRESTGQVLKLLIMVYTDDLKGA